MNPKVSVMWSAIGGLYVRGGWGKSFNAPRMELRNPYGQLGFIGDFADFGTFGAPFDQSALVLADFSTAQKLGPERSKNWYGGIEWAVPWAHSLKAHIDYYEYNYTDRIGRPAQSILDFFTNPSAYTNLILVNPSQSDVQSRLPTFTNFFDFTETFDPASTQLTAILLNTQTNLAKTRTSGLQLGVDYSTDYFGGVLDLSIAGNKLFRFENGALPSSPLISTLNYVYSPTKLKLRSTAGWRRGVVNLAIFGNYVNGYTDNLSVPNVGVSSWTTFDLHMGIAFDQEQRDASLEGLSLALNVQNVVDREPPHIAVNPYNSLGFDPTNANPLGRFVSVEIRKRW
jgi:hypothetical protein